MNKKTKNIVKNCKKHNKNESTWLKFLLGIFIATDDMPYSANEFFNKARESRKNKTIWALLTFFWISLFCIICISILFLKNKDTLFNVIASTEIIEVSAYSQPIDGELKKDEPEEPRYVEYPPWSLDNIELYNDCGNVASTISGLLTINSSSTIEFIRLGSGKLQITLDSEELDSVGSIKGHNTKLSDCIVLEYSPSKILSYTLPIDGIITIGSAIKEAVSRSPILLEGHIYIADKAVISQEYYSTEPYRLTMGDKLTIKDQSTQSSGFILINDTPGMNITYASKGDLGVIEKYKSERISLKNSFWTKIYNDETVILLWILLGMLYTTIKVVIRLCLEEDD